MSKFAIIGSRGYVGSNLKSTLGCSHQVVQFSHTSNEDYRGNDSNLEKHFSLSSLISYSNNFDILVFLLESKNAKDREFIKKYLLTLLESTLEAKVIIFSSISVYSSLRSRYVEFKLTLEKIAFLYQNTIIFRVGVIFGGSPGGLYKTFLRVKAKKFLLLPCGDSETGYTHIMSVTKQILSLLNSVESNKVQNLVDMKLSLKDGIIFFGFRGYFLVLPSRIILLIFYPFLFLLKYFPLSIQSLLTLGSTNLSQMRFIYSKNHLFLRKILLTQYFRFNNPNNLNFNLRKFIRVLEINNSFSDYINLSHNQRFIFFKRFSEILKISLQK